MRTRTWVLAAALPTLFLACGEEPESRPAAAEAPSMRSSGPSRAVEIVAPVEGDTVDGPAVSVVLAAHDFAVVPAGDTTANSGHHHLFLDRDVSPAGATIPAEAGHIVHIGTGADRYTFDSVAVGEHRLIAVVGDAVHVPVTPALADTVVFVVR